MVAVLEKINLDFDDDLAKDAEAFGQQIAQGDADKHQPSQPIQPSENEPTELERALHMAREVYGETNSRYSDVFNHWVKAALEGKTSIAEAKEMLSTLYEDRNSFALRSNAARLVANEQQARRYHIRRMAVICAQMVTRAVLNKLLDRPYGIWIRRSLWRAAQTEGDVRGDSILKGRDYGH